MGASPSWDPGQYDKFADERLRPGLDLMARIPPIAARQVWDLGCGTGELTARLAARFPEARTTGLDSSPQMLAKARAVDGVEWVQDDIAAWTPDAPPDVIYTNATLQWLPEHAKLLPRLVGSVAPGGVFACQMPNSFPEPSHRLMRALAGSGAWAQKTKDARPFPPIAKPEAYVEWLSPLAARIDLWETRYWQVLRGEDPVVEWVKGTGLRPYLDALTDADRPAFLKDYAAAVREAYPRRPDGTTLYPFPRLFMVVVRA
jgi:trans-aconitate 2-methyltransferase